MHLLMAALLHIGKNLLEITGSCSTDTGDILCNKPEWFKHTEHFYTDMEESGYKMTVHLYKAEEYGVPQIRHRYIIVGIRADLPVEFHVPSPEPYKDIDVTAGHALAGIPEWASNNEVKKLTQRVIGKV